MRLYQSSLLPAQDGKLDLISPWLLFWQTSALRTQSPSYQAPSDTVCYLSVSVVRTTIQLSAVQMVVPAQ